MLGHLAPAEHRVDRLADGGRAVERVARTLHPLLSTTQLGLESASLA
jgi:hypothetical protein